MQSKLWTRDFTIITLGSAVSILGNSIAGFAMSLLVLDYTNSTFLYTLYVVAFSLPFIIMPLVAGPVLDRFRRKTAIYSLDFLSAVLYIGIYFLLKRGFFNYGFFLALCVFEGCISSVYQLAYDSFYPNLVSEGNFSKAYSISSLLYPLSALMTPVAAWIYERVGIEPLFLANSACFFIAACFEVSIKTEETHVSTESEVTGLRRFAEDFAGGVKYLKSEPGLLIISVYFLINGFCGAAELMALPYFRTRADLGVQLYTYVMLFSVLGRFIGGLIHYKFKYPVDKKFAIALIVYISIAVMEGSVLFMPVAVMMLLMFMTGIMGVTSYNIRISATQSYIPDSHRARFNGIFAVITTAGTVTGQLLSGAMAEVISPRYVAAIFCGINLLGTSVMFFGREHVKKIYNRDV